MLTAHVQDGNSPLILAASEGNKDIVDFLLARGANVNARGKVSDILQMLWTTVHELFLCCSGAVLHYQGHAIMDGFISHKFLSRMEPLSMCAMNTNSRRPPNAVIRH
jgi:ankyrin repeat protein